MRITLSKDIAIDEGEDSTIIYTYTFAQPQDIDLDSEALKTSFDPQKLSL